MTDIVTARVPAEIRQQGNSILEHIGSSPTELVRAAYAYVIATGELPQAASEATAAQAGDTAPTPAQLEELRASLAHSTLPVPADAWPAGSYKQLIAEGRAHDYEGLA